MDKTRYCYNRANQWQYRYRTCVHLCCEGIPIDIDYARVDEYRKKEAVGVVWCQNYSYAGCGEVLKQHNKDLKIVVILPETGERYISTELFEE